MKKETKAAKTKRNMTSIEWDDDVFEMIEEAKRLNPNFSITKTVNAALRKHGEDILAELAEEQKLAAENLMNFLQNRKKKK
jgi:hypothetical protein